MKRTKTSKQWMQEHVNDPWVHRAKAEGYRSRAAFKLTEIDQKDRLLAKGQVVVELGAAPGSWTQVVVKKVMPGGRVFALDLLEFAPIEGVEFIQGDFTEESVLAALEERLGGRAVDLVLSDIAPNISGIATIDQGRSIYLCELALDFAERHLMSGGNMLVKVFQGSGFDEFRKAMGRVFSQVHVRKPAASRDRSSEVYLLGLGKRQ
ncbi:RlmE family RNA methyltransferase [Niveibacterium umoris]|uniref:Ribosomal RNA large subunit methyltransferase E n=1 Tax=Niveibacterium umoris TaxID=1193620 RepID=A0A840BMG1_9RHOO|nr:RlmE family RNA methyltransferase [Niveibacterium umoris]MBB4012066.1 23S rRNA (uridine2552-2'-O)-methyltransferase [Niveibacterium umoris]